jgi:hypothetical protein
MGFGQTNHALKLPRRRRDSFLAGPRVVAHVPHLDVGFDKFVSSFFGDDRLNTGASVVDVRGQFLQGLGKKVLVSELMKPASWWK